MYNKLFEECINKPVQDDLNEFKKTLVNQLSDYVNNRVIKLNDNDFIIKNGWLFVNMNNTKYYSGIEIYKYKYPLMTNNPYLESYSNIANYYNKPFKEFINNDVDFKGKYPTLKNNPFTIKFQGAKHESI